MIIRVGKPLSPIVLVVIREPIVAVAVLIVAAVEPIVAVVEPTEAVAVLTEAAVVLTEVVAFITDIFIYARYFYGSFNASSIYLGLIGMVCGAFIGLEKRKSTHVF